MDGTELMGIIAITNQKGGTGKTTTAINLAAALGELGHQVLVVDLDPQANATLHAGLMPEEQERTIWSVMKQAVAQPEPDVIGEEDFRLLLDRLWEDRSFDPGLLPIVRQPNDNPFDLIPSSLDLSEADLTLVSAVSREHRLATVLGSLQSTAPIAAPSSSRRRPEAPPEPVAGLVEGDPSRGYEYIFIDCPPHLGILTLNALTAADAVIIPLESAFFASKGMNQLFRILLQVKQTLNHRLGVLGVLITRVDLRTVHSRQIATEARKALEKRVRVFETEIPINVDLADASAAGVSITRYAPNSRGAEAYRQLAKEIQDLDTLQ